MALAANLAMVAGQVVAGGLAHSLALLADAGHDLADAAALALALVAIRMTRRPPTPSRSFGYHRSTVLAAQANAAGLLAITGLLAVEAVRRLVHPTAVRGGMVLVVAAAAMAVNGLAALAVRERGGHDLNVRSAVVHLAGDALASAVVAVAGAVVLVTGRFHRLDAAATLAVGAIIAWQALALVRETTDVLLEATPAGLDVAALAAAIAGVAGVEDVHDLHAWSLSSEVRALSAHLVLAGHPTLEEAQAVGNDVRSTIAAPFAIAHATFELECETCEADCSMDAWG
jgi:cobalt-zinc-cadmium efflux system protein